jgi:hypothetical protein
MTVFNLDEKPGVFFDMDGGGRVQLRSIDVDDWKAIRKQTVRKKVDFKKVDGTPGRFEYEEVNEDLQNELFWDKVIVSWENFLDGKGVSIPCTKENKILLMSRSAKFAKFVGECLKQIAEDEGIQAEQAEKNSQTGLSG